jgi:hypothetical protein
MIILRIDHLLETIKKTTFGMGGPKWFLALFSGESAWDKKKRTFIFIIIDSGHKN